MRLQSFIETRLTAGMTADAVVALSVKPDKALVKRARALEAFEACPEAHGALLAALGKPLPKEPYQLRLDTLVARSSTTEPARRDPGWLGTLELGAPLGNDVHTAVWAESEVLLGFPASARAEVVLAAVEQGEDRNHAIQLVRVLEESDAARVLKAAITSASPPSGNWLDFAFRRGSHPRVAARWTVDSLLARLSPEGRERFLAVRCGDVERERASARAGERTRC